MPNSEHRFLIVRLSSMGDIVHTLPAFSALRASFPSAQIHWLVDEKWQTLVASIIGLDDVIPVRPSSWSILRHVFSRLRRGNYSCAIDFQGLYKSALLARASGASRRVGFAPPMIREDGATLFYTERIAPLAAHVVDKYLALAEHVGARLSSRDPASMFPLSIPAQAEAHRAESLAASGTRDYFVLSPGGGWISKCWPPERYGELHRRLARRFGYRGVISFGPGERALADSLRAAAGDPEPLLLEMDVQQLMALLRGAHFFVGGDSGPLHLAGALGTPVVGIYGPTDPSRNGPYWATDIAIRNAGPKDTTHHRGKTISETMLSISVEQVEEAVVLRMSRETNQLDEQR